METGRNREPLLPVQSLMQLRHCECWWRDRALLEGQKGLHCNLRPLSNRAFGKHSTWKHHSITIYRTHTITPPCTYPWVKPHVSHRIAKCICVVTHTYKEAQTFPQTCWHPGILALRVIYPLIEGFGVILLYMCGGGWGGVTFQVGAL